MSINVVKVNYLKINNILLNSFLGNLIKEGKKYYAINIYIKILESLKSYSKNEIGLDILLDLIHKLKPAVNIRSKKVAGINYQLPSPITDVRASKIAVSWFFKALSNRSEKTLYSKVLSEFLDIKNNKGYAIQKKQYHEKLALDNRPFLHFLKK
jgi:small subunit ribosomal protein S7